MMKSVKIYNEINKIYYEGNHKHECRCKRDNKMDKSVRINKDIIKIEIDGDSYHVCNRVKKERYHKMYEIMSRIDDLAVLKNILSMIRKCMR